MALSLQERDSYKGMLDSYEHELTITGGQFQSDKLNTLEKIIETQKQTIEQMEMQLSADGAALPAVSNRIDEAGQKVSVR